MIHRSIFVANTMNMKRRSEAEAAIGIGLVCPACGVHAQPDPAALKGMVVDLRSWARALSAAGAVLRARLSRLAEGMRQMPWVFSRD